MYVAEGDLSDISKMISSSLSAFHLITSKTESVAREDVRGVGCMLYGGAKFSQLISVCMTLSRIAQRRNGGSGFDYSHAAGIQILIDCFMPS